MSLWEFIRKTTDKYENSGYYYSYINKCFEK